jgi:NADH-quinone oxidoreductase subunit A
MLEYVGVLIFLAAGFAFVGVSLFVGSLVRPSKYSPEKFLPYECGENPVGSPWVQFNIRFYVFALIYIVFAVEAVFLLPWAVVFKDLGLLAFVEGVIFIAILVAGLAYLWAKGDLEWVRAEDRAGHHQASASKKVA